MIETKEGFLLTREEKELLHTLARDAFQSELDNFDESFPEDSLTSIENYAEYLRVFEDVPPLKKLFGIK